MSILSPLACLESLVGLSRTKCECYDNVADEEATSGLYIDDLTSLRSVSSLLNCEDGHDLWEYLTRARELAVTHFYSDFNALLMKHYKLRRQPFAGVIGKFVQGRNAPHKHGEYAIHRMVAADITNGVMTIKRIGAKFDKSGTINLVLADNIDGFIDSILLSTEAGKVSWTDVNLTLPMHSDLVDNIEYYFYYQMDDKVPAQITLSGCSCKYHFDSTHPRFASQTNRGNGFFQYIMTGSNRMINADCSKLPPHSNNYYFGLVFDVELKCNTEYLLCQEFDFETNNLTRSIALAIWYKAGYNLGWKLSRGENINRWSQIDYESIKEDLRMWEAKYNDIITYIVEQIDVKNDDCLICRDAIEIRKSGILT